MEKPRSHPAHKLSVPSRAGSFFFANRAAISSGGSLEMNYLYLLTRSPLSGENSERIKSLCSHLHLFRAGHIAPVAAPGLGGEVFSYTGLQGVSVEIPQQRQTIGVSLDEDRFVPPPEKQPVYMVPHAPGEVRHRGLNQQMVVGIRRRSSPSTAPLLLSESRERRYSRLCQCRSPHPVCPCSSRGTAHMGSVVAVA